MRKTLPTGVFEDFKAISETKLSQQEWNKKVGGFKGAFQNGEVKFAKFNTQLHKTHEKLTR